MNTTIDTTRVLDGTPGARRTTTGRLAGWTTAALTAVMLTLPTTVFAQDQMTGMGSDPEHTLPLTWDRWLDHDEIGERMQLMAETWPEFLSLGSLGDSHGGRELWVMTINNPDTGPAENKAAMWIEANIHGNEIQGAEVSLYTIWYLMENYDRVPDMCRSTRMATDSSTRMGRTT